jgi:restriction system protein
VLGADAPPPPQLDFGDLLVTFFHAVTPLWPFWLFFGAVAAARAAFALYDRRRLARSGISDIDTMDGKRFEIFLSTVFRRLGYEVEVTQYRGDYGADLVIASGGRKIAVQAKRWKKNIGLKAVQEAVASKALYRCDEAMVVTNRYFTAQARRLAKANGVVLWDRDVLVAKLLVAADPALDAGATETARCAACGVEVSEKVRDYCRQHAARFDGRVYCFKHQRSTPPPAPASA